MLLHYRAILLRYRAVITLTDDYYIIGCNTVITSAAVIGESSDYGGPSNMLTPCSTPSWNWFSKCFAMINDTLYLSAMTWLNSSCTVNLECYRRCNMWTALNICGPSCKRSISLALSSKNDDAFCNVLLRILCRNLLRLFRNFSRVISFFVFSIAFCSLDLWSMTGSKIPLFFTCFGHSDGRFAVLATESRVVCGEDLSTRASTSETDSRYASHTFFGPLRRSTANLSSFDFLLVLNVPYILSSLNLASRTLWSLVVCPL